LGGWSKSRLLRQYVCIRKKRALFFSARQYPANLLPREYHTHAANAGRQDRKHVCYSARPRGQTDWCGTTHEFTSEY
jgi:hypothetical protein